MMPPANKSVSQLAREHGVGEATLYAWRSALKKQGIAVLGDGKNAADWSSQDKFAVVVETAALNGAQLSEYCRRKGLFPEQIEAWREMCATANASARQKSKGGQEEAKQDKKRIRQLEKELMRKEKALAEAAALLILRKKVQAIWGDKEED